MPAVSKRSFTASVRPESGPGPPSPGSTCVMNAFQRSVVTRSLPERLPLVVRERRGPAVLADVDDDHPALDAQLASRVISKRHVIDVRPSRSGVTRTSISSSKRSTSWNSASARLRG